MEALREAGAKRADFVVFVEGGIRHGADIFKAVLRREGHRARGAHVADELQMVMRLSGTTGVSSISEKHFITKN